MDENLNNSYETQSAEPDYFELYKKEQEKKAKGVFSRIGLALTAHTVVLYCSVFLLVILLTLILGADGISILATKYEIIDWLISFIPQYLIAFPIFYLILRNMRTLPVTKKKMKTSEFFFLFLIAQALTYAGNLIGSTLSSFIGSLKQGVVENPVETLTTMPIWLMIIIVVIVGPIIEELMFRKLIMDRLSVYGNTVAIVVSAVAFGLFHGNFYQFFYTAFFGAVLGYMYAKTRDVRYPIAMHMLFNLLGSVIPLFISDKASDMILMFENILEGIEVDMAEFFKCLMITGSYTVINSAMLVGGIVLLYKYIKEKRFNAPDKWEYKLPREKIASITILNPGSIVFLIVSVAIFAYSIII